MIKKKIPAGKKGKGLRALKKKAPIVAKKNMGGSMNPAMARSDMASGYYPSDMGMEGGAMYKKGGKVTKKKKSKFPDHSGDGKITKKDILMAKGVIPKTKNKNA